MPIRTLGEYLERRGFTVQQLKRHAYEPRPAEVRRWLQTDYPAIQAKAKQDQAEISWGDETGLRSERQHARGNAPKGRTPGLRLNTKRASLHMIAVVPTQGKGRFRLFEGSMNAARLLAFLTRLLKDAERQGSLMLDNLRGHHARSVKTWLKEHVKEIAVCYLPAYSLALNPEEYWNGDLKHGVHTGPPARSQQARKKKTLGHLHKLQQTPARVGQSFKAEPIRSAV